MGKQKSSIIVRLIPFAALLGTIITLALTWSDPETRDGSFYYFLFLMAYACVMLFFSDYIFLGSKKHLTVRIPVMAVAAVHIGYLLLILLLRLIFSSLADVYFILATLISTSIQVALSLWIYKAVGSIDRQQHEMDQKADVRAGREILLADLKNAFKAAPGLAQDAEMMRKLDVFCNAWKYTPNTDTSNSYPVMMEIHNSIQALTNTVLSGAIDKAMISGQLATITSLIERRAMLLKMK